jgi:microcystin-dependent protein
MPLVAPPDFVGKEVAYSQGSAPPNGPWLLMDGSAVSRTTYANLFALWGTTYGVGDGSTTFNLKDMRGRMPVGIGTHADVDAFTDADGLAVGSRTPNHTHGPGNIGGTTGTPSANVAAATPVLGSVPSTTHTHNFTATTGVTGSSPGGGYATTNWWVKT